MKKRLLASLRTLMATFLMLFATNFLPVAMAHAQLTNDDNKVQICHATNSDTNPYNVNDIAKSAADNPNNVDLNGHGDDTGPVWDATLKTQKIQWGDIIPPFTNGAGATFAGYNWDTDGQAIWNNDCNIPTSPAEAFVPAVPVTVTCGPDNDVYGDVPAGPYGVTRNGDGSITLTADSGYIFADNLTTVTLNAPIDENTECPPTEISIPTVPITATCGPDNDVYATVPDGDYTVTRNADRSVTLTAKQGFVFPNGQSSITLSAPVDGNTECPSDGYGGDKEIPTPPTDAQGGTPTGTNDDNGDVLAAVTTVPAVATVAPQLANTGDSIWTNIFVGLSVMTLAVGTVFASRKQYNS